MYQEMHLWCLWQIRQRPVLRYSCGLFLIFLEPASDGPSDAHFRPSIHAPIHALSQFALAAIRYSVENGQWLGGEVLCE